MSATDTTGVTVDADDELKPERTEWQKELDECGLVSHKEAKNIAQAYIDVAFKNPEKPGRRVTHSIPACPRRDTDIRLMAYIGQQEERDAELRRAMAVVNAAIAWQNDTGGCHFCGFSYEGIGAELLMRAAPVEHEADCPLVAQGFIMPDGRRVERG
jgi:hypothetical protein